METVLLTQFKMCGSFGAAVAVVAIPRYTHTHARIAPQSHNINKYRYE